MSALAQHLKTLRILEDGTDRTDESTFCQFCQCGPLRVQGEIRGRCPSCDPGACDSGSGLFRLPTQPPGEARAANDDPIAVARARGWHVELRPVGLLIDTRDHAPNLALMDRLHGVMQGQEAAWPAAVLADPAEITLRGELDTIEGKWSR